jgi:hypothetical protein
MGVVHVAVVPTSYSNLMPTATDQRLTQSWWIAKLHSQYSKSSERCFGSESLSVTSQLRLSDNGSDKNRGNRIQVDHHALMDGVSNALPSESA